jgi:hypothetical protein
MTGRILMVPNESVVIPSPNAIPTLRPSARLAAPKTGVSRLVLRHPAHPIYDYYGHIFFPLKPDSQRSKPKPSTAVLVRSPQLPAELSRRRSPDRTRTQAAA